MILKPPIVAKDAESKRVVVGTAGHVDHGKTALVYALTGTDTDRLPEEKQRGMTIDLGFAALELRDAKGARLELSLIDVPGHQAFIRNMLAGTGGIDLVLLVIAADEGVKPQTLEHLAICELLGIERGLIALTKVDAVSAEQLRRTHDSVIGLMRGTFLEGAPIVPVSALHGTGMKELKSALAATAAEVCPRSSESVLRLPVDRSFSIKGFGTVVTGTLCAGSLRCGDTVEQQPSGRRLRVRGLQVHGRNCDVAAAPSRVAVNLAEVEVAEIRRGDTLVFPQTGLPTLNADVQIRFLKDVPVPKHGSTVRVHAFTSERMARVLYLDRAIAEPQGGVLARLQFAEPLLLHPGDRLVLRQCSPAMTIGGGVVLDSNIVRGQRRQETREWLMKLRTADAAEQLRLRAIRYGVRGISLADAIAECGLTEQAIRNRVAPLVVNGALASCGGSQHWVASEVLAEAVEAAHRALNASGTCSRAELRTKMKLDSPVFELVLERLVESGKFEFHGESIAVKGRTDQIPEQKRKQLEVIERLYASAGLASPLFSEVKRELGLADAPMRELMTQLLRSKRLVRMRSDDAFVHPQALQKLYSELRRYRGEVFDVARFKTLTGLTRKHAIPLLEHLDEVRVTRNNGGVRVVL